MGSSGFITATFCLPFLPLKYRWPSTPPTAATTGTTTATTIMITVSSSPEEPFSGVIALGSTAWPDTAAATLAVNVAGTSAAWTFAATLSAVLASLKASGVTSPAPRASTSLMTSVSAAMAVLVIPSMTLVTSPSAFWLSTDWKTTSMTSASAARSAERSCCSCLLDGSCCW